MGKNALASVCQYIILTDTICHSPPLLSSSRLHLQASWLPLNKKHATCSRLWSAGFARLRLSHSHSTWSSSNNRSKAARCSDCSCRPTFSNAALATSVRLCRCSKHRPALYSPTAASNAVHPEYNLWPHPYRPDWL